MITRLFSILLLSCAVFIFNLTHSTKTAAALLTEMPDAKTCFAHQKDAFRLHANINLIALQTQVNANVDELLIDLHRLKFEAFESYLGCLEYLSADAKEEVRSKRDADLATLADYFQENEPIEQVRVFMLSEVFLEQARRSKDPVLIGQLLAKLKVLVEQGEAIEYKSNETHKGYEEIVSETYKKHVAERLKKQSDFLVSDLLSNASEVAVLFGDRADAQEMLTRAIVLNDENSEAVNLFARLEAPEPVAQEVGLQISDKLSAKIFVASSVKFNSDGTRLLVQSRDGIYREWNWTAGKIVRSGKPPKPMLSYYDVGYTSDEKHLYAIGSRFVDDAIGDVGEALEVWEPASRSIVFTSTTDDLGFQVPTEANFIVRRNAEKMSFLDLEDGDSFRSFELSFSGKYKFINEIVSKKNFRESKDIRTFEVSEDGTKFLVYDFPAQKILAFGDTQTGKVRKILIDDFNYKYFGSKLSSDGKIAAVSNRANFSVLLFDTKSGKQIAKLSGHGNIVREMFFLDDGRKLITLSRDTRVILWDVATGKKLIELPSFDDRSPVRCDVSPDGKFFATNANGVAQVWEIATGKLLVKYYALEEGNNQVPNAGLALLPNGRFAAVGLDLNGAFQTLEGKNVSLEQAKSMSYGQNFPIGILAQN